jgi:hypothetical protein
MLLGWVNVPFSAGLALLPIEMEIFKKKLGEIKKSLVISVIINL